jgi:predicted nucleotidyltransferase
MPQSTPFDRVFALEQKLGASWPEFHRAHERTLAQSEKLDSTTSDAQDADSSIVVFGSVARYEVTDASDIDWVLLVNGQADLAHQRRALSIGGTIDALAGKKVGREGTFGKLVFSHDVVQYIGGGEDTNANFTRRMLLLLESRPIGARVAYDGVVRVILERYLTGDHGWAAGRATHGVPRFLLNDIVRYWRTIAVDHAYKQWTRDNREWALRSAKLRLSRKLIYASGLLCCFGFVDESWASDPSIGQDDRKLKGLDHLLTLFAQTPLDRLAAAFDRSPGLNDSARQALDAYDSFLGILSDEEQREHLEKLESSASDNDSLWKRVRDLGVGFQDGLDAVFLDDETSTYPKLIRKYGVF